MAHKSTTSRDSRYVQGGTTQQFTNRLGWWDRRTFPSSVADIPIIIQPQYHKRPDKMAFDAYGKSTLMWLILQYNNIVDINIEFVAGATIMLPAPSRVQKDLLNKSPNLSK